jgi:hypothetical protein
MPPTKQDVLDTLSSYYVSQIDFQLGTERISADNYSNVRQMVDIGRIQVNPGASTMAWYHPDTNTLDTQLGSSPPNIDGRALLLHECTHAIVNVEQRAVTELTNEVIAYIAQHVYLLLANPLYVVAPNNAPWFNFFTETVALVKKFKLHKPEGRGARLSLLDYFPLRNTLSHLKPHYDRIGLLQPAAALGPGPQVPVDTRTANDEYPQASDEFLMATLRARFAANDVAGYGARVKTLEQIFSHMDRVRAGVLRNRFLMRQGGDTMSMYFHDHLSTPTRMKLLQILQMR